MIQQYFILAFLSISITIPLAYAQTPTIAPNLRFQEQPAYIQVQSPPGAISSTGSLQDMLIPVVVSAGGILLAKLHSDKKTADVKSDVKETKAEVLVGKEVDKEIAKVAYAANPESAAKVEGVPIIKNEVLAADASQYAQKVVKDATNDD